MISKSHVGQLLSDQMSTFLSDLGSRKAAMIEPECYDDEAGDGFDPLSRSADYLSVRSWGDRVYRLSPSRWEA